MSNSNPDEWRGDSALIARLRDGDESAFDLLVDSYAGGLIRHAARIIGSDDSAREVVQEVFLRLWRTRGEISPDWDVVAYLYGSTRRRAINFVQSEISASQREYRWIQELDHQPGQFTESEDELSSDREQQRAVVWNAARALSPRCREVFLLVWDRRLSYAEISALLGVAEPTVRRHMSRAIQHLAELLGSGDRTPG